MRVHCLTLLLVAAFAAIPAAADEAASPTLHVLGARIRPLKPDGKAWDGDHRKIPPLVYTALASAAGVPPLSAISLVPYRNRPDPYLVVLAGDEERARADRVQGTFLPEWSLPVPLGDDIPATLRLVVRDDDLRADDDVGHVVLDVAALRSRPGRHRLEGTGGLADVDVVFRDPAAGSGPVRRIEVERLTIQVRERRPAGGDWDVGGVPLRDRIPKRVPVPDAMEGLALRLPDLRIEAHWLGAEVRRSPTGRDDLESVWAAPDLAFAGRSGQGDGLVVFAIDADAVAEDPVGVVFLPWEDFVAAADEGRLVREPDAASGLARLEVAFRFAESE